MSYIHQQPLLHDDIRQKIEENDWYRSYNQTCGSIAEVEINPPFVRSHQRTGNK